MRVSLAAAIVAIIISLTAATFAIWPVVANAPWIPDEVVITAPLPIPTRELSRCQRLWQNFIDAQTEYAAGIVLIETTKYNCQNPFD